MSDVIFCEECGGPVFDGKVKDGKFYCCDMCYTNAVNKGLAEVQKTLEDEFPWLHTRLIDVMDDKDIAAARCPYCIVFTNDDHDVYIWGYDNKKALTAKLLDELKSGRAGWEGGYCIEGVFDTVAGKELEYDLQVVFK